jgi:3-oxoacyl-[acyl-carrier protein] reductase
MSKNTVLIVGASSAIGCEIIRQISDDKTLVLAHYYSGEARLAAVQAEVQAKIVPLCADLSTEDGIADLLESVGSHCDFPQKMVFLAAPHLRLVRFKDLMWEDFKHHSDMQLCTAVTILRRFLPQMAMTRYGRVVFMLSSSTLGVPPAAMAHYVTAKYALLGLMRALSSEYAGKHICINGVSPSMVETDFLSEIPEKIVEMSAQEHPLKRNATPTDIAPIVKFLLSEEAGYLTGVNIPVAGGIQV